MMNPSQSGWRTQCVQYKNAIIANCYFCPSPIHVWTLPYPLCPTVLLAGQPPWQVGAIQDGSIGFLKGAARVTTAIAAVVCCNQMGIEVPSWAQCSSSCFAWSGHSFASSWFGHEHACFIWQVPKILLKGLQSIKCKHIRLQTRQEELFLWYNQWFTILGAGIGPMMFNSSVLPCLA